MTWNFRKSQYCMMLKDKSLKIFYLSLFVSISIKKSLFQSNIPKDLDKGKLYSLFLFLEKRIW